MDLNKNGLMFCNGDTTLRLDCFGYGGSISAGVGGYGAYPGGIHNAADDSCELVLGLGPTRSSGCDYYSGHPEKTKSLTNIEDESVLKLGLSGGSDEFSGMFEYSVSSQNQPLRKRVISLADEGSTSAKRSGGYMPSLLLAPSIGTEISFQTKELLILEPAEKSGPSPQISSEPSAISSISSDRRISHFKRCQFDGCSKGARGSTGLCIGHGGGQRCHKPGCNKGAESRTAFCKAHGGGKRCDHLGCTKSAEGKTDYCISHGGGRRCGHPSGCSKAARGKSGLCIRHGGGKRCKIEGCARSAEGQIGLCISHGGGRRCQISNCPKGAQGSTNYCKAHGGGKRCIFAGCTKGAEGSTPLCKAHGGGKRCFFDGGGICPKSVHGGTNFCVAHGGGKRCSVSGCTKSARGRTDCCVKHGGGKRCKFENCEKSAQGSTDFCKAHGGGKRCSWGEGKCEKFARGKSGLCAAHSSLVHEKGTKSGGMIGPGLFCGLVSATSTIVSGFDSYSSSDMSVISDSSEPIQHMAKRQQLIPPQVLVPLSMRSSSSCSGPRGEESSAAEAGGARKSSGGGFRGTEGRVHGGGLMSFLGGNMRNAVHRI